MSKEERGKERESGEKEGEGWYVLLLCRPLSCRDPGAYLRQCGAVEVKLGQALLLYHSRVQKEFLTPLKAFLEVDVKNIMVRTCLVPRFPIVWVWFSHSPVS